jgi:NAD(P)-dependent dehydrogenase (short-subunit alcohol dehydrogenase family)
MKSVLITGSNRGLGLEWARQYAVEGWRVYASCRFPEQADELQRLAVEHADLSIHRLDVTRPEEIRQLGEELGDAPLDLLVNNAGIYRERWGRDRLGRIDYGDWQDTLAVNTLGAIRLSEALIENLARSGSGLIVAISSHMGSIAEIGSPNDYAYRSSKAALNAAMKGLSLEIGERGVGVLLFHPGWVRTRMGGEDAPLSPEDSVAGMRRQVAGYTSRRSGRFYGHDGHEIPW